MRCLLSIDWDYFIKTPQDYLNSYIECQKSIHDLWYKRYFKLKSRGIDIKDLFKLDDYTVFWDKIKERFRIGRNTRMIVSDSHKLSYNIAQRAKCKEVYLFDSHADLGYGGLASLEFEISCANWLGKLFIDGLIHKAYIIYSPNTYEDKDFFRQQNEKFDIEYLNIEDLDDGVEMSNIHIARSGTWTPPWYDGDFMSFLKYTELDYKVVDMKERIFDVDNLTLADMINYLFA